MHNLRSDKIDTDLHTELLKSFRDMVQKPCAIHLANPLFMRMSWLGYLIFLIQVSPTSGSTSMKALIPIIPFAKQKRRIAAVAPLLPTTLPMIRSNK